MRQPSRSFLSKSSPALSLFALYMHSDGECTRAMLKLRALASVVRRRVVPSHERRNKNPSDDTTYEERIGKTGTAACVVKRLLTRVRDEHSLPLCIPSTASSVRFVAPSTRKQRCVRRVPCCCSARVSFEEIQTRRRPAAGCQTTLSIPSVPAAARLRWLLLHLPLSRARAPPASLLSRRWCRDATVSSHSAHPTAQRLLPAPCYALLRSALTPPSQGRCAQGRCCAARSRASC